MKQLAVVLSPGNKLKFELLPNCVFVFQTDVIARTKHIVEELL